MLAALLFGSNPPSGAAAAGVLVVIAAISLALYFLPSIIGRKKRNFGAIFALNLLLGWSVIGWIVSLVWALTKDENGPGTRAATA
ncbi:MAG: superinfection immunity protein [Acidobacteriota bacterium]